MPSRLAHLLATSSAFVQRQVSPSSLLLIERDGHVALDRDAALSRSLASLVGFGEPTKRRERGEGAEEEKLFFFYVNGKEHTQFKGANKEKLIATLTLPSIGAKTVSFSREIVRLPSRPRKSLYFRRRWRARLITVAIEVSEAPIERAAARKERG